MQKCLELTDINNDNIICKLHIRVQFIHDSKKLLSEWN
jgi:hypothetical protein